MLFAVLGSRMAFAQTAPSTTDFVKFAEMTNANEIQAGHIAAEKGRSAAVRHFGQKMIHDYTQLEEKLDAALAKDKDTSLRKSTPLDAAAQAQIEKFNNAATGAYFGTVYIYEMVKGHEKAIAEFKSYIKNGKDSIVRNAAQEALPVIEEHLAVAEKISRSNTDLLPDRSKMLQ